MHMGIDPSGGSAFTGSPSDEERKEGRKKYDSNHPFAE